MKIFTPKIIFLLLLIIPVLIFSSYFQTQQPVDDTSINYTAEDFTRDSILLVKYSDAYYRTWEEHADYDSMFYYKSKVNQQAEKILENRYDSLIYFYYVEAYSDMGYVNLYLGKYDEVQHYIERAIDLAIKNFGENSLGLRSFYIAYNAYFAVKGEYGKAEDQLKKALRVIEINHGENHPKMISGAYWNLGLINEKKGDYRQAAKYYQKSADVCILNNDKPRATRCYDRIGSFHQWKGEYEQAIENFNKILGIIKENPKTEAIDLTYIYLRLAAVHLEMGAVEKANEFFALAPEIEDYKTIGRNHFNIESNYSDLGDIYMKRKDFEKANYYYQKLLELVEHFRGSSHIMLAEVYNQIGKFHLAKGESDSALIACQKALSTLLPNFDTEDITKYPEVKKVGVGFILPATLALKAAAFNVKYQQSQELSDLELSMEGYRIAAEFIDLMRSSYLTEASKHTLAERAREIYMHGIEASMKLYEKTQEEKYISHAFGLIEKSKSIILLEAIQKSNANEFAGLSDEFLSKEQQIKTDLAFYEKVLYEEEKNEKTDSLKIEKYKGEIFKLQNEQDNLIARIRKDHPEYYALKYNLTVADIPSIQNKLPDKSALVEYFFSDSALWTFVITKNEVVYRQVRIDDDFYHKLETMRDLLRNNPHNNQNTTQNSDRYHTFIEYSSDLYKLLLRPVVGDKDLEGLTIIPDGQLGYLPFQVLMTEQPGSAQVSNLDYRNLPYLFKDYKINYEYSSSILLSKTINRKPKNIYAGFAPDYNNEQLALRGDERGILEEVYDETVRNSLHSLMFNKPEVERSSEILGGMPFLGPDASEQAFKANSDNSRILHLAMHALTNDINPLYSQLIFSESTDSTEDGNLHAYELYNMQLNADLAVLSACNTGVGKLQSGEGIMSLARAFKYAGCPNIVMSLWKANDESTKEIMVDFHKNLKEGEGKGLALENAKKNFLATCDQKFTHPYYWATFVLIGDNEPIDFGRPWWMYALIGAGGLILLFFALKFLKRTKIG